MSRFQMTLLNFIIYVIIFYLAATTCEADRCRLTSGRYLNHNESTFVSCDTKCTCLIYDYGQQVYCEATCLGNMTTSNCSWVRKPGDYCCEQGQCPAEVKLDDCSTINSVSEDLTQPWHVLISNGGVGTCAGVMIPPSGQIITRMGCVDRNSRIFGNDEKTYIVARLEHKPELKISKFKAFRAHKNIAPGFHEINPAPDENFCATYPTTSCALFVSYFYSKNDDEEDSGRLVGVLSNDTQCIIKGQSPNTKCVQVSQTPGACRNLTSGSAVYVQVNDFPYLVGVLAADQACSDENSMLIPFYDICKDIENSK